MNARVHQSGQAMTETLAVALAIAAALLLPWLDGEAPASLVLGALAGMSLSFQAWLFLL